MSYGIPYKGSKSKVALWVISQLPKGKRLVDLFGGGGAITHCGILSGKYESVLYNEKNKAVADLFQDAVNGKYGKDYVPQWISHEQFFEQKDKNAFIKIMWSFGNNCHSYLFGKDIEPYKKALFYAIVNKNYSYLRVYEPFKDFDFSEFDKINGIDTRRKKFSSIVLDKLRATKKEECKSEVENFERLSRLQNLERLDRLENVTACRSSRLAITSTDYRAYKHEDGDVVYCDPPYEKTSGYGNSFDTQAFYDWASSQPFDVYFSSFEISDSRFRLIAEKRRNCTMSANSNSKVVEKLYKNH